MKEKDIKIDPQGEDLDSAQAYLDQKPTMPDWVASPLPKDQNPRVAEELYKELKSACGLDHYAEINRLMEAGDKEGLKKYADEKLSELPELKAAVIQLIPFVG